MKEDASRSCDGKLAEELRVDERENHHLLEGIYVLFASSYVLKPVREKK